ncbi:hypothetical protein GCM10010492_51660 [Saccharothrix mutabilis subsp. mutabilis]|uniref:Uncharacterized protein n=1 Tax=Saccharothrix mutabilis subsp. mutabilis TaxID=66855 RepID=A0ABP3E136_9PSEU
MRSDLPPRGRRAKIRPGFSGDFEVRPTGDAPAGHRFPVLCGLTAPGTHVHKCDRRTWCGERGTGSSRKPGGTAPDERAVRDAVAQALDAVE